MVGSSTWVSTGLYSSSKFMHLATLICFISWLSLFIYLWETNSIMIRCVGSHRCLAVVAFAWSSSTICNALFYYSITSSFNFVPENIEGCGCPSHRSTGSYGFNFFGDSLLVGITNYFL